jgi:hypothetical protein
MSTPNFELQTQEAFGISLAFMASTMPTRPEPFHVRGLRFACAIVKLYRQLIRQAEMPPAIARQLLRAGTSIGANLPIWQRRANSSRS